MSSSEQPSREEHALEHLRQMDAGWSESKVESELLRMHARTERERAQRRVLYSAGALAAAAAVALAFGLFQAPQEGAQVQTMQRVADEPRELARVKPIIFGDGSSLVPSQHADVVVQDAGKKRVVASLRAGQVRAKVTPNRNREFVVHAGLVDVIVLGTEFDVERMDDGRTRVAVTRGHVRVAWPQGNRELRRGEEGVFPPAVATTVDAALAIDVDAGFPDAGDDAFFGDEVVLSPIRVRAKRRRQWKRLARRGGYDEAYAIIKAEGDAVVHDDKVDDLLLAADAARLSGHPKHALKFLDKILKRYAKDERAPMAAFTKGRLLLAAGNASGAASAFEGALKLGASGSLRENALARAVEANARAGRVKQAKKLAEMYVQRYPDGKWVGSVREHGKVRE